MGTQQGRDGRNSGNPVDLHMLSILSGNNLPRGTGNVGHAELEESAARAMLGERMRQVARKWPGIVDALGAEFEPLFEAFAMRWGRTREGAKGDARGFLRELRQVGRLPEKLQLTLMDDAMTRFPLRVKRMRRDKVGLAVAVRLPGVGVKVWGMGWKRAQAPIAH